jgi:hypothetical protein
MVPAEEGVEEKREAAQNGFSARNRQSNVMATIRLRRTRSTSSKIGISVANSASHS